MTYRNHNNLTDIVIHNVTEDLKRRVKLAAIDAGTTMRGWIVGVLEEKLYGRDAKDGAIGDSERSGEDFGKSVEDTGDGAGVASAVVGREPDGDEDGESAADAEIKPRRGQGTGKKISNSELMTKWRQGRR